LGQTANPDKLVISGSEWMAGYPANRCSVCARGKNCPGTDRGIDYRRNKRPANAGPHPEPSF